jgi:hypothetical protein
MGVTRVPGGNNGNGLSGLARFVEEWLSKCLRHRVYLSSGHVYYDGCLLGFKVSYSRERDDIYTVLVLKRWDDEGGAVEIVFAFPSSIKCYEPCSEDG